MSSTPPPEKQVSPFNFSLLPVAEIQFKSPSAENPSQLSKENNNRAFLRASQPNLNLFGVKKDESNGNMQTLTSAPLLPSLSQNTVNNSLSGTITNSPNNSENGSLQYHVSLLANSINNNKDTSQDTPSSISDPRSCASNTDIIKVHEPLASSDSNPPVVISTTHQPSNSYNNNITNNQDDSIGLKIPKSTLNGFSTNNNNNDNNNLASELDSPHSSSTVNNSSNNNNSTLIDRKLLAFQDKTNPFFASGAADFQHYEKQKQNLMMAEIAHLEDFISREKALIELYKSKLISNLQHNELETITKHFGQEISSIWSKKSRTLSYIIEGSESNPFKSLYNKIANQEPSLTQFPVKLIFLQQPSENAIANRYMVPAPAVCLEPGYRTHSSSYIVSVSLAYHGAGNEVVTTIDGKHEMLQGIKKVTVDSSGTAIFNKLKIMEVSSKHRHQPFCLVFSLEEYSDQGNKRLISTVKSVPFHVQSRPNKRKSTGSLPFPPAKHFLPVSNLSNIIDYKAASSPSIATLNSHGFKENDVEMSNSDSNIPKHEVRSSDDTSDTIEDENFIDITELLILPQKEAAKRLGISESMLCKRFKECTKRKWPYRYLRKIDKVINTLTVHKNDSEFKPREDKEKLERLNKERIECLQPVKIRITTGDKLQDKSSSGKWTTHEDEDISDEVLETLETMRMSKNSMDPVSPPPPPLHHQPSSPSEAGDNQNNNNNKPPPSVNNTSTS